jgi:upstream activation factor subunit UAF30
LDPTLSAEFLKENKEAVDEVIASVFERVSAEADRGDHQEGRHSHRAKEDDDDEEEAQEDFTGEEGSLPPAKKSKKGTKQEQADAELARKLSSEINGRSTRTSGKGRGSSVPKRGSRSRKSAATVNSDDESNEEGGKKTRKRTANGSGAKGGFAKEFALR